MKIYSRNWPGYLIVEDDDSLILRTANTDVSLLYVYRDGSGHVYIRDYTSGRVPCAVSEFTYLMSAIVSLCRRAEEKFRHPGFEIPGVSCIQDKEEEDE